MVKRRTKTPRPKTVRYSHNQLCALLEGYLRTEAQMRTKTRCVFGEVGIRGTGARADVVTMEATYRKPDLTFYEVKAHRSDLMRELQTGKWEKLFGHCNRFYYALPPHLASDQKLRDMFPKKAGVIVLSPDGGSWRRSKLAIYRDTEIRSEVLLGMIFNKMWKRDGQEIDEARDARLSRVAWMRNAAKETGKDACRLWHQRNGDLEKREYQVSRKEEDQGINEVLADFYRRTRDLISWKLGVYLPLITGVEDKSQVKSAHDAIELAVSKIRAQKAPELNLTANRALHLIKQAVKLLEKS